MSIFVISLSWFKPSQQLSTTQSHSLSIRIYNSEGWKWENSWLRVKFNSSTGKAKSMHANKAKLTKESIHHFLWAGKYSAMPRRAGPHHTQRWLGKTNVTASNIPFFLLPLPLLHHMIWDISLLFGVSCPKCVSSKLLVHPWPEVSK